MDKLLEIPCGIIKGCSSEIWEDIFAYRGIKYANAERFKYPVEITKWEGIYDATKFGNSCYQERSYYDEDVKKGAFFYFKEFRKDRSFSYSEDCQYLNIYIPQHTTSESNLPVMIFIHGGSFMEGGSDEKPFIDPVWPRKYAIAVTINYRLGPFGFACSPELKAESGHSGNYGIADQITAIQWIKHNIKAFGGNPDNITLLGQSAGAMCTYQLCLSPISRNLISKAVMFSGAGEIPLTIPVREEETYNFWEKVFNRTKCQNLEELRKVPSSVIFSAWLKEKNGNLKYAMAAKTVIDDFYVTEDSKSAAEKGHFPDIPYIAGTTSEDIASPIFYEKCSQWCEKIALKNQNKVYKYFFHHKLPGDKQGAWHSSDLWYWFGTIKQSWRPMNDDDEKTSDYMTSYLVNFAYTGDPNPKGKSSLPEWKPFNPKKAENLIIENKNFKMGKALYLGLVKSFITHLMPKAKNPKK